VLETLPESVNFSKSNAEYFGVNVQLNTELTEASDVYLTLVNDGAGWKNSLGFYTYDLNNPPQTVYDIDSLVIIFPNVSQPEALNPGDKVLLGDFPANTGIGYFLIAQGWTGDRVCLKSHIIFTDTKLNTFTTEEYRQQTILLSNEQENKFLLSFEDIIRPGGDNDFNDLVFYITAQPDAIDTTNIPKIPTALLSGDTTICDENANVNLKVELSGQAPWTIKYTNGIQEIEISDIQENVFFFETTMKDTITLVSVKDKNKIGIAEGQAIVNVSLPKATLSADQIICGGGEKNSGYIVNLEGIAPFSLTFKVGDQEKTISNILENKYELTGEIGQLVQILKMSDNYCDGTVNSDVTTTVRSVTSPGLTIDGSGAICGEDVSSVVDLMLTGEGPWIVNYQLGENVVELPIETNNYKLEISQTGTLTINSISDKNCTVTLFNTIPIDKKTLPSAEITDYQNICGTKEASVNLSFTGQGPWIVYYSIDDVIKSAESNEETMNLNLNQSGQFELLSVEDMYCTSNADGSLSIEIHDSPTANISGDAIICNDEEVAVEISLTGTAPYSFVYSDGETETTITTSENIYSFKTNKAGSYSLISIDDANCSGEITGTATILDGSEEIQVEIDAVENSCFGDQIELSLIGETENLTIIWSTEGKGSLSNTDQTITVYTPAENETGVIVFYTEVNNGCSVKTISKEVTIIEKIDASFDFSPSDNLLTNSLITFIPSNNGYDEYNWEFGDGNTSTATMSSAEYVKGGIYTVKLIVNNSGCESEGSADLEVLAKDELYVPNAFNPSAQNPENQVVKVYGNNVSENGFAFKIINRWGKVMYKTNSFAEANTVGWNGVNNNNDVEQELNVFTYLLKGQFIEGEEFERAGTITQVK
jgi:PKD repeat protein